MNFKTWYHYVINASQISNWSIKAKELQPKKKSAFLKNWWADSKMYLEMQWTSEKDVTLASCWAWGMADKRERFQASGNQRQLGQPHVIKEGQQFMYRFVTSKQTRRHVPMPQTALYKRPRSFLSYGNSLIQSWLSRVASMQSLFTYTQLTQPFLQIILQEAEHTHIFQTHHLHQNSNYCLITRYHEAIYILGPTVFN